MEKYYVGTVKEKTYGTPACGCIYVTELKVINAEKGEYYFGMIEFDGFTNFYTANESVCDEIMLDDFDESKIETIEDDNIVACFAQSEEFRWTFENLKNLKPGSFVEDDEIE